MKVFNGTPHNVVIINKESCIFDTSLRKWVSSNPDIIKTISSNGALSAKIETKEDLNNYTGIPVYEKTVTGCDDIPEAEVIICSMLYVSACRKLGKDTSNLYTVADTVYSIDGKTILGCLGICPAF